MTTGPPSSTCFIASEHDLPGTVAGGTTGTPVYEVIGVDHRDPTAPTALVLDKLDPPGPDLTRFKRRGGTFIL